MHLDNYLNNKKNILDYFKKKKFEKVIKFGKKLLNTKKNDFQLLYVLGLSYLGLKNYSDAEKVFKLVLNLKPTAENYFIYGSIQKQLQKLPEALNSFQEAINLNSNYSDAYNNLANIKKKLGFVNEAIENYQKAINCRKNNLEAHFNLAQILKEQKKFDEVRKIYLNIIKIDSNNTIALNDLGSLHLILGEIDEARKLFEKVLKLDNYHIKALKNYTTITKIDEKNEIYKKFKNINFDTLSDEEKILAFSSLSKCNFDKDDIKLGIKYLEKSNKIKKLKSNFSINKEKKLFRTIKFFFEKNLDVNINHEKKINFIPVFVLGMPRSGTTLIEQILSSHSKIYGSGELNYLPKIIDNLEINENQNFENFIRTIRHEYNKRVSLLSDNEFIIDKLPMNFRWIGFIAKAFPEAKIIHIQRNPMAVCWSNYKMNFTDSGMDFSLSQKDTAEYYILYNDLMNYWFNKLNNIIININYDNFVRDFEQETENLIKKLKIKWEENLLNYYKNNRPVETASFLQVRRKIIKNSSDQWKNYSKFLEIMQDTLKINKITF